MKSMWTIAVLGILAFAILAITMLFFLKGVDENPDTGPRIKLAIQVQETFRFEAVVVDRVTTGDRTELRVTYDTEEDLQGKDEALQSQMRAVAVFTFQKIDSKEREGVDRVHVVRQQIHRSGCSRGIYKDEYRMVNPDLEKFFKD
jgi:hypothetical protein